MGGGGGGGYKREKNVSDRRGKTYLNRIKANILLKIYHNKWRMYFRNIYKTLQQLERDRTKVKQLPQTVMFLFHLHNFVVSCSNSSGGWGLYPE